MIKFRTGGYGRNPIEEVEVERETDKCVWINGQRSAKHSSWHKYWDTWDEAHDYLLERSKRSLESARRALESAHERHETIKAMISP